jgi:hypothetical protein
MTISEQSPRPMPAAPFVPAIKSGEPSWPWRRTGLLLAGAAQLLTIAAIIGVDPPALTWAVLLLAIAPALLAGLAAIVPPRLARLVVTGTVAVLA